MYITVQDLNEFRRNNYPYENDVNLKGELFDAIQPPENLTGKPFSGQENLFDISNLVVDAETLEEQITNQSNDHDPDSEYAKLQREHKIRFRNEVQEKGLHVKKGVQAASALNY